MDQPKSKADQRRETRTVSGGGGGTREKPDKPKKDKKDKGKTAAGTGGSKRNKKAKKDAPKPMTRVVIRHLPPTMTEELLREQISVDGQMPKHDEFYFVGPDWSLGVHASSRAYINFIEPEDIFRFTDSFDGYTFVDTKGMEYQAVVEYAPLQKLPKNRSRKKDAKCNTIESDSHFISFKEALEAEEQEALHGRGTQEFSFKLEQENKTTTTPLLEFIAQKKQEKRDERRRKQEEKRKARDEERHTRKTQIAKAIPAAIKEEKDGGDIVVRTVLSRLNPQAQHAAKGAGSTGGSEKKGAGRDGKLKDDKDKKARNRKEKDRTNRGEKKATEDTKPQGGGTPVDGEKHGGKKQDREKSGKKPNREKDKPKEENRQQNAPRVEANERQRKEKEHGAGGKADLASTSKPNSSVSLEDSSKKEVKKYSERRKETRARAETRFAEQDIKKDNDPARPSPEASASNANIDVKKSMLTANVAPFIPKEKTTIILAGPSSTSTNNPAALPSTKTPAGSGSSASKAVKPISEETTSDHGKSPSPDDSGRPDENVPPKVPNEKISEKVREAREARKIRNKDRPSIEIYQPRKRIVPGAGKSEEDRGRSDSDRPSDSVSTSAAAGAGQDDGGAKERRHKLTKKASDRQPTRERKNGRKNSTDVEGSNDAGWWI
ncbi:regulator of nonsense transcripts 3B isoform X2 [Anopheles coustani]|uniref:regulator of nonsense transcripts 3B isoform X2 n=1 Tax=Anopheles coustani TaxID=139045 RepID=UPI0026597B9D|nr:regulator of nonsense transcripts 3B isoform X2 [Anopheles coustani]